MKVSSSIRNLVITRSGNRCEYCRLHQDDEPYVRFHVEHIVARQHGGPSDEKNLALACFYCNAHKGPNLVGIDPASGAAVTLFNPRSQSWDEHFQWRGPFIDGTTAVGRATVRVLSMNDAVRVELRLHAKLPVP